MTVEALEKAKTMTLHLNLYRQAREKAMDFYPEQFPQLSPKDLLEIKEFVKKKYDAMIDPIEKAIEEL